MTKEEIVKSIMYSLLDDDKLLKMGTELIDKFAKEYHTEQLRLGVVVESKTKITNVLNKAVSAIYFNDNSDYIRALYGIVNELIEQEQHIDIQALYKSLNPD